MTTALPSRAHRGFIAAALLFAAGTTVAADDTPSWCADRCDDVVVDWNARRMLADDA